MRGLVNDCLRYAISHGISMLGLVLSGLQRLRMFSFRKNQERLNRKYRLSVDTPVLSYGPQLEVAIKTAARARRDAKFAMTSGSTGGAKSILYTRRRLRSLKFAFSEMFARACWTFRIKRTSLYVFSSFHKDTSLTTMLLDENKLPHYLSTLQAPYRVQRHAVIQALAAEYGSAAVRLWLLTIANPGVLYSTNPSTISTFLDELASQWHQSSRLIKDWCNAPERFDSQVRKIARRIESRGSAKRLRQIAASNTPVPLEPCAPGAEACICWTGGYVKPFLDRLATQLPSQRYRLIPMYSMSTETIETVTHFQDGDVSFLPLAGGVLYEFIEDTGADRSENLLRPDQLQPGNSYAMVVSDAYGLRRYQTGDLFLCKRKVKGLPDLVFVRRRGLEYSFTGEKLTAVQVNAVFDRLRLQYPPLVANRFLTCVPSHPSQAMPHYKILLIGDSGDPVNLSYDLIGTRCDELLSEINCEYKSKRASGRLGPVRFMNTSIRDFAERFAENNNWETQFKFLPLYQRTWESRLGKHSNLKDTKTQNPV